MSLKIITIQVSDAELFAESPKKVLKRKPSNMDVSKQNLVQFVKLYEDIDKRKRKISVSNNGSDSDMFTSPQKKVKKTLTRKTRRIPTLNLCLEQFSMRVLRNMCIYTRGVNCDCFLQRLWCQEKDI